jgi:hypothetical protein|eukprot:COSAG02_NODE_1173_length_14105_cov_15.197701_5_plen_58_part_00
MLIYDGLHYDALGLEADGLLEAVRVKVCIAKDVQQHCIISPSALCRYHRSRIDRQWM